MNKINYSLSDEDIRDFLNNKVKIITHDKINNYNNINDLIGKYNKCIILYKSDASYGHWCCLFKNKYGINFFDSYGNKPDEILNFLPNHINKALEQDHDNLIKLLYNSNYNIYYNEYPLQEYNKNINTCGRWCIFRLICKELNENEFYNLFKNNKYTPDEIITNIIKF
jgi:hypothetical protein